MAKIVKDGRPVAAQSGAAADRPGSLEKPSAVTAVSAVAAPAEMDENEPNRSSRETLNARGQGVRSKKGSSILNVILETNEPGRRVELV